MAEVVILISNLMLADLQGTTNHGAAANALLQNIKQYDAVVNYSSVTPNPNRHDSVYLTVLVNDQAQQLAENLRGLDGVYSVYVKPEAELPF